MFIYKLSEAPLIKIESLCMMQSFVLKGREMLNHDATWNLHLWTLKEFLFSTLFCTHLKIVCLNATKYAREVEEESFSRLYSVHTLDFFFANCHSCLTTYFHISKLWQLYAHNLLMSISKHSEEKLSLLVHFYWEMVNKSLRTSHTQCLKIAQKYLIWIFVVNK